MIVRCVHDKLTDDLAQRVGSTAILRPEMQITRGGFYCVLAIKPLWGSPVYGDTDMLYVIDDVRRLSIVPSYFFEIVNNLLSDYWRVREYKNGIMIGDPRLTDEFVSRLMDGDLDCEAQFDQLCRDFLEEAGLAVSN